MYALSLSLSFFEGLARFTELLAYQALLAHLVGQDARLSDFSLLSCYYSHERLISPTHKSQPWIVIDFEYEITYI